MNQDGGNYGVFARRFSSTGESQATEFQVNSYTTSGQRRPSLAMDSDGDFVVIWDSIGQDRNGNGVFARRFSSTGSPQATEFGVNSYTLDNQNSAVIGLESDGDFVVAWSSFGQDGSEGGIFVRRFGSSGIPLATEFRVNSYTPSTQGTATLAIDADSDVVIAWGSSGQDGSMAGIFARGFALSAGPTLDIDGNESVDALTDTLLFLRYAFGFRGAVLIAGAFAGDCTRCTAPEIEAYIASVFTQLDVDGNGAPDALTDALLCLRYAFGFRGAVLIDGAVADDCAQCTAPEIEAYIASLVA